VVDTIENCSKPVVAAIHGTALGGGLEIALGCHYRVAVPSAKLGVPEVKLGLLPGAGGTQRLPRVAGVQKSLEMVTSGTPIGAKEAYDIGLVDRLIEGDPQEHAVAYAEEVRDVRPLPKSSERQDKVHATDPGIFAEFRKSNARKFRGFEAPEKNIQAIEAAVAKPYAEGVMDERRLFMELMSGTQDRGRSRGHETAGRHEGRRYRRRHHGWRHFHELPVGRIAGDDRRDDEGSARPRHRRHAQELRS
jgi:3-hydroxyacyl-CoA dehydrogenase